MRKSAWGHTSEATNADVLSDVFESQGIDNPNQGTGLVVTGLVSGLQSLECLSTNMDPKYEAAPGKFWQCLHVPATPRVGDFSEDVLIYA